MLQFMFAGKRHKTPDTYAKGFITHSSNRRILAFALVPSAPTPTGQRKEGHRMPAHALGCAMEKTCPNQD